VFLSFLERERDRSVNVCHETIESAHKTIENAHKTIENAHKPLKNPLERSETVRNGEWSGTVNGQGR
jgi:hypothetical protein